MSSWLLNVCRNEILNHRFDVCLACGTYVRTVGRKSVYTKSLIADPRGDQGVMRVAIVFLGVVQSVPKWSPEIADSIFIWRVDGLRAQLSGNQYLKHSKHFPGG